MSGALFTLYKPQLNKIIGDLQWHVFHGIIPGNAFVSVLNSVVQVSLSFLISKRSLLETLGTLLSSF